MARAFCGSADHAYDRRGFLGSLAAGAAAFAADMTTPLNALAVPTVAGDLKKQEKRRTTKAPVSPLRRPMPLLASSRVHRRVHALVRARLAGA